MYVCLCNGVTEREIRQAAQAGCESMAELTMRTGCGASCGCCVPTAIAILEAVRLELAPDTVHGAAGDNVLHFPRVSNAA